MTKTHKILSVTTAISVLLFILSLFSTGKTKNIKAVKSALLNPGYKEKIQALIIQTPEELITIRNESQWWTCEKQGVYTFADKNIVSGLINNLTKIRNMYKISDTLQGKIDLKLTEDSASIITVIDSSGNAVSKLYFGGRDTLTSRINLSTEKGKLSYETQDDFSSYLKTDLNFWTVPEIFFSIKNPSNLSLNPADLHTLLSLRHGQLYASSLPLNSSLVTSVTLKGQYNSSQRVDFYVHNTTDGPEYFYIQHIEPEVINNNAVFEISQWTFDRIKKLLNR